MPCADELLLLPGLDGTGRSFEPLLQAMPLPWRDRCRVISYPSDKPLSYAELLDRLKEQIPPDRRVVLIAESMGGALALKYAAARPDVVAAVVMSAAFVRSPIPALAQWIFTEGFFQKRQPDWAYRLLLLDWRVPREMVEWARDMISQVRPDVLAHRVREVIRVNAREELRQFRGPILYLRGRRDWLVTGKNLRRIQSIRPDVQVATLDAPHMILQVRPAEAWERIAQFLSQRESPAISPNRSFRSK